ncbi:hypothetical protein JCM5350_006685 [Sporobolomyces pararoseus]
MERKPPLPPSGPLQPPALLRIQGERPRGHKGKGKAREPAENEVLARPVPRPDPPASTTTSLAVNHGPIASSSRHDAERTNHSSNGNPRRLGLLGIPLSDSEEEDEEDLEHSIMSSESLEANPPISPVIAPAPAPAPAPPAPTYSRGGSTRSGPSTRGERQSESAGFVSEQNFRDIVDDLTLQNQQLRAKLKRLESAKVPSNMKDERLFEVRFFQGLPKSRRREIENFLTDYVQTLSTSESRQGSSGSIGSRAFRNGHESLSTSGRGNGDTVSSMGRSLRSSEKDAMARATLKADADAAEAAVSLKGSRGSGSGAGSRSGTGSGNSRERRSRADGVPRYDPTLTHEPLGSAPITTTSPVVDPPSLLRRPADIFPPDRDVLAAPSFSGVEPVSTTGTGHDMRISDPASRKRKRIESTLSNEVPKDKHRRPHSTRTSSTAGSAVSHDPDTLENTIVQMIECLFLESLPPDSDDETPPSPPANPLQSEPFPLPARSSSNTQYLRTILASEEYRHVGGWVYLNIVATFAALHRLSASISTVRHALRTRSDLIEVSGDGSKIRWRGPSRKPPKKVLETQTEVVEKCNSELVMEKEVQEQHDAQMEVDRADQRSRSPSSFEPSTDSIFDDGPFRPSAPRHNSSTFATSTAPTSLNPTVSKTGSTSKNGSEWQTGGSSSNGTRSAGGSGGDHLKLKGSALNDRNNSSLRNTVEEVGSPARRDHEGIVEALGSAVEEVPKSNRYQYIPLFAQRAESPLSTSEDSPEAESDLGSDDSGIIGRLPKRRKGYEGGVVYFSNDLFCSDLAGDFEVRAKLKLTADSASSRSIPLGDTSSRDPMEMETDETESASRSGIAGSIVSDSKRSEEAVVQEKKEEQEEEQEDERLVDAEEPIEPIYSGNIFDRDHPLLELVESMPLSPELHTRDAYLSAPQPALRLSAMSEAIASDHFTIHIKYFHRLSISSESGSSRGSSPRPYSNSSSSASSCRPFPRPSIFTHRALFTFDHSPSLYCIVPRPVLVEFKTLHHHPSVHTRPPRVLMSLSSDASDAESESGDSLSSMQRHFRASAPSSIEERRRKRRLKNSVLRGHRFESTTGGGGGGGDYLMSLALPLNGWAPVTKRSTPSVERLSSSRAGTGSGEPSESLITLD